MDQQNDPRAARKEELYNEIMERRRELVALMREDGSQVRDHTFETAQGSVRLSDLFGDRRDLIVVHNMGQRCPMCTFWADGLNGIYPHLENRAAFVVSSPDVPERQQSFATERGWRFPMVSDQSKEFTREMGFLPTMEGKEYWYPGYSTFRRDDDGTIRRVGHDFFGPFDNYNPAYHMFEMLEEGVGEWFPEFHYGNS